MKHTDCILYRFALGRKSEYCSGLKELYCVVEQKECPFYKSVTKHKTDGTPKEQGGVKNDR